MILFWHILETIIAVF